MGNGALFYKADIHIHSYGPGMGSYDVTDATNTPQAIVDLALAKGLKIISVTDHNEIVNSIIAVNYSYGKDILVLPGIEVSTTQGHLLLYFETADQLRQCYGHFTFNQDKSFCNQGIVECLTIANQYNGIGILAHITLDSGFEKTINRFGPQMESIFQCQNLLGLEIVRKDESRLYTDEDSSVDHKHLLEIWRQHSGNKLHRDFAKLMSSDSHELAGLGCNVDGNNRLTRIKMPVLSFRAFRNALLSSESRVRLEDEIPELRPIIKRIRIDGGLLDGVDLELSPNLTCIIGSRGAGKSTLLESIREGTGNRGIAGIIDTDVWPQTISLEYDDEVGQTITMQREKNSATENRTDPVYGITTIPIESYGQGATASTLQHSDENPQVIIDFLDSFLPLDSFIQKDKELIELIRENQSEARKLRLSLIALPEIKKALENEKNKLKILEASQASEIVKYHNALIKEREFRSSLISDLKNLISTYKTIFDDTSLFEKVAAMTDDNIVVGKAYFNTVKSIVEDFGKMVSTKYSELNTALQEKINSLNEQLKLWKQNEASIQTQIDAKKEELTKQGIPFDLGKINQITKDIIDFEKKVNKLEDEKKKLFELEKQRKNLIQERLNNKKEINRHHISFATRINEQLKNSVDDFYIKVKYSDGAFSPEFEAVLKDIMGWRTSQVPKARAIARSITVYDFVNAVKGKDRSVLADIQYNGSSLLSNDEISSILFKLNENNAYEELECISYDDLPQISVTKIIEDENGNRKPFVKKISQLSLGQQQSVLLGILLLSDSVKPLLIDQPEDNLDSEFIYKTIVATLRRIKEHRQVIIVTHNPNIAVLGDAELVVPLKSTNNKSRVMFPGSVDDGRTVELCCQILEGGESAFKQRQTIYGF